MATQDVGTGQTYTTPQLWEDSLATTLTEAEIGEGLGEEFTGTLQVNGHTTTAANYIEFRSKSTARHDGRHHAKSGAGNSRINHAGAQHTIRINDEYCRLRWMEVQGPGDNEFACIAIDSIAATGSRISVDHNIAHNDGANTLNDQHGIWPIDTDAVVEIQRNLVFGMGGGGINNTGAAAGSVLRNNTVFACNQSSDAFRGGIGTSDTDFGISNNAAFENPNADIRNVAGTLNYNATEDTTGDAEGANGIANLTTANQFVNPTLTWADLDLLLKAGADLIDAGEDLSASGLLEIDTDIKGDAVTGTWDIGAAEYVSAGGPQDITGAGAIASAEAFGTAVLDINIAPTGIASEEAFGTATLTTGEVTVSPTGIASAEAFGTANVFGDQEVAEAGAIASAEAVPEPTVTPGSVTLSPTSIETAEAHGTPTVDGGDRFITGAGGIGSGEGFGTPTLTGGTAGKKQGPRRRAGIGPR